MNQLLDVASWCRGQHVYLCQLFGVFRLRPFALLSPFRQDLNAVAVSFLRLKQRICPICQVSQCSGRHKPLVNPNRSASTTARPTVAAVRGIPDDADVASVKAFFSRFGAVADVDLSPAASTP
jgi:hypothetical protein